MILGSMKRRDNGPLSEPLTLSIVIPAFNEGPRLIDRAARLIDAITAGVIDPRATELILVDDGSTDDTSQRALDYLGPSFPLMRVLRLEENSGKGAAIRVGASAAGAPIVAFMDADMSVDPSQIPMLLAAMARYLWQIRSFTALPYTERSWVEASVSS
jgi:dolichyl-phosphate beta-glucosyltransferase